MESDFEDVEDEGSVHDETLDEEFLDSLDAIVALRDSEEKINPVDEMKVVEWAQEQQQKYSNGTLSRAKIAKLKAVGFDFDAKVVYDSDCKLIRGGAGDDFSSMLEKAINFKIVHGHLEVNEKKNKVLHDWIENQKLRFENKRLSSSEEMSLTDVGIIKRKRGRPSLFPVRFEQLEAFVKKNGNCNIPPKHHLYGWIQNQRQKAKNNVLKKNEQEALSRIGAFDDGTKNAAEIGKVNTDVQDARKRTATSESFNAEVRLKRQRTSIDENFVQQSGAEFYDHGSVNSCQHHFTEENGSVRTLDLSLNRNPKSGIAYETDEEKATVIRDALSVVGGPIEEMMAIDKRQSTESAHVDATKTRNAAKSIKAPSNLNLNVGKNDVESTVFSSKESVASQHSAQKHTDLFEDAQKVKHQLPGVKNDDGQCKAKSMQSGDDPLEDGAKSQLVYKTEDNNKYSVSTKVRTMERQSTRVNTSNLNVGVVIGTTSHNVVSPHSNALLTRLNRLYDLTGTTVDPSHGLLKRLQHLEFAFFGSGTEVRGIFIHRLQLLEKELIGQSSVSAST